MVQKAIQSEFYHGQEKRQFGEEKVLDLKLLKKAVDKLICYGEVDQVHYINDKPYAIVYYAGYRGMISADQLEFRQLDNINGFVGRRIAFIIKGYEEDKEKSKENKDQGIDEKAYIFAASRTEALDAMRTMTMELDSFQEGVIWPGTVLSVEKTGALIDLGGVRAWLPISEVSHSYVADLSEVIHKGDYFDVKITTLDKEDKSNNAKVQVSIKALIPAPWEDVTKDYHNGDVVKAKVVGSYNSTSYFLELKPGVVGLADKVVDGKTYNLVEGEIVRVAIKKLIPEERKVRLKIKSVIRQY